MPKVPVRIKIVTYALRDMHIMRRRRAGRRVQSVFEVSILGPESHCQTVAI